MVCNAVYLNPLANFKQWYTPYENENQRGGGGFRLNNVILFKVQVKSINNVALTTRASNCLSCDAIRLGDVYVCDDAHDEILEKMFQRNN